MEENNVISTTISHPRTSYVEMFSTRDTSASTFKRGRNYVPFKDFQDPEAENAIVTHR